MLRHVARDEEAHRRQVPRELVGQNLFIVDGSVFVTGGGVNPTATIQAVALHVADEMKKRLADLFD